MKVISQNTGISFPIWLNDQIVRDTRNYTMTFSYEPEDIELVSKWVDATNPDLSKFNTFGLAVETAYQWKKESLSKRYKTNDVVYDFKDGWKIVKVPIPEYLSMPLRRKESSDITLERELMRDFDGDYTKIYSQNNEQYFEQPDLIKGELEGKSSHKRIIYSLRDPNNMPKATIELYYDISNPQKLILEDVYSSDPISSEGQHPQKDQIKLFFDYLKSKGYYFDLIYGDDSEEVFVADLPDVDLEDQFGIPKYFNGINGAKYDYAENLEQAFQDGSSGSYWYSRKSFKEADALIEHARITHQIEDLEAAFQNFEEECHQWYAEYEGNITFEHPLPQEPSKEDFMIPADTSPQQPEFSNMPPSQPIFDEQKYQEALKQYEEEMRLYEEERESCEENFEPYIFSRYVYLEIQKAKNMNQDKKDIKPLSKSKTRIYKIATDIDKEERMPNGESMALYITTLRQYLKDNPQICDEWKDLINNLPSARQVRQDFSHQECKVLYETLEYLWTKITGQKIIPDKEIIEAPERLRGNYIMLCNGILLKGINTYDIVKRNDSLISSLLDIGGMTMQEYLSRSPNDLIKFIIGKGALRIFITVDGRFYSQCSPETYGKWARDKIRKLDFKKKVVKVIDMKSAYKGWDSGLVVIL